ncbi:hypothetical protein CNMCM6805_009184 [Aspergillus fumigatiaffinis]|uniref:Subtelomeric hrmA-associated cluster protein AFUB-079030/YDR124W-like helical bundle domain-containing protein n=1 Tax=Aspergillus fumigatiaffinis TaxID=340414 RepID=A0A8H4H2E1_9EURO|nr:hypothetical protein CNMCM6805_009184 [Aspergillus fumigatiaffinis]
MLGVGWRLRSPECVRILPAVDGMHVASWDGYSYDHQYWEWDNASMPAFDMAATYPISDAFGESVAHGLTRRVMDPLWPLTSGQVEPGSPFRPQGTPIFASGPSVGVGYPARETENMMSQNGFNAVKEEVLPRYSVSGYATVEQPLPSLPGVCTMWERVLTSFKITFEHYAMIYLDHVGQPRVVESPPIQGHGTVFTFEAKKKTFMEILERSEQGRRVPTTSYWYGQPQDTAYHHQVNCVKASVNNSEASVSSERFPQPFEETSESFAEITLTIRDTTKIVAYYKTSFEELNQNNCRLIANAFIKFIEPKNSQSTLTMLIHKARRRTGGLLMFLTRNQIIC